MYIANLCATTVYLKRFSTTHVRVHTHYAYCTSCRLQKCRDVRSNVRSNLLSSTIMRNTHFHCIHTYALHTGNIECTLGMVKCAVDTTGLDPVRCYTPNMCLHIVHITFNEDQYCTCAFCYLTPYTNDSSLSTLAVR